MNSAKIRQWHNVKTWYWRYRTLVVRKRHKTTHISFHNAYLQSLNAITFHGRSPQNPTGSQTNSKTQLIVKSAQAKPYTQNIKTRVFWNKDFDRPHPRNLPLLSAVDNSLPLTADVIYGLPFVIDCNL